MYRILGEDNAAKERRRQRRLPKFPKPEHEATAPHQVWCWDISEFPCLIPGQRIYLYAIIDLFSRYIVGYLVDTVICKDNAEDLLSKTFTYWKIDPNTLRIHSDRGATMTSEKICSLYARIGVSFSFSRPRVSNDNPHIESFFKTAKNRPEYEGGFKSLSEADEYFTNFMRWYNYDHYHSGISYYTPASIIYGTHKTLQVERQQVMTEAYNKNPILYARPPLVSSIPEKAYINPITGNIMSTKNKIIA